MLPPGCSAAQVLDHLVGARGAEAPRDALVGADTRADQEARVLDLLAHAGEWFPEEPGPVLPAASVLVLPVVGRVMTRTAGSPTSYTVKAGLRAGSLRRPAWLSWNTIRLSWFGFGISTTSFFSPGRFSSITSIRFDRAWVLVVASMLCDEDHQGRHH